MLLDDLGITLPSNKLTKRESTLILTSMQNVLENVPGFTPLKAIKYCIELHHKNSRIKKIMTAMYSDIRESPEMSLDVYELYRLMTPTEAAKYGTNNNGSSEAAEKIKSILEVRSVSKRFEPLVRSLFQWTLLGAIATFAALYFGAPWLVESLTDTFSVNGIKDPLEQIPFYLINRELNLYMIIGIIIIVFLSVYFYVHNYINNRRLIYKIFNLKSYDDIPIMFETMKNIYKSQKETIKVFRVMGNLSTYKGLSGMFLELEESVSDSTQSYYDIFMKYSVPHSVCLIIKANEAATLMDNLDGIINSAKAEGEAKFASANKIVTILGMFFPMIIPFGFGLHISYLFESGQSMSALGGF